MTQRVDANLPPDGVDVSVSSARAHLPSLVDRVRDGGTVYLSRYGKRIAALVPADAAEFLDQIEDDYWAKRADEVMSGKPEFVPLMDAIAEWEAQDA